MFFSKWFKPEELPETDLEKEYTLMRDVLKTLREAGAYSQRSGDEAHGYRPIYEYALSSNYLPFGTLGAKLNKAECVNKETHNLLGLQKLDVKESEVPITRCTWEELGKAVDTLAAINEVMKELSFAGMFAVNYKTVHLTKKGVYSLNTRKYESLYKSERDKRELKSSTLDTNLNMVVFTSAVAIAAVLAFIVQLSSLLYTLNTRQKPATTVVTVGKPTIKSSQPNRIDTMLNVKKQADGSILRKK